VTISGKNQRRDILRTLPVQVDRHGVDVRNNDDLVAVEEPLEIQVRYPGDLPTTLAVVMRTPGDDLDLAVGFVVAERVVASAADILEVQEAGIGRNRSNIVAITVRPEAQLNLGNADRFGVTSSACGVCGKTAVEMSGDHLKVEDAFQPKLTPQLIQSLPAALGSQQELFASTGGTHAMGLADSNGLITLIREDVGRHTAMDKAIGAQLRLGVSDFSQMIAVVSSRASFELVQKALVVGIPVLVAVGSATSLAVQLAAEHGLTLIGFASADRFNVYTGRARIS
jgi:FdhD protein